MHDLSSFTVSTEAMRPGSEKRQCFYCMQVIGSPHRNDCVLINRDVYIRMTIEYKVTVPASWDAGQIESHRNEGSWCSNNAIDEISKLSQFKEEDKCLCDDTYFKYICDAGDPYISE